MLAIIGGETYGMNGLPHGQLMNAIELFAYRT
jgi:hypothetical protein